MLKVLITDDEKAFLQFINLAVHRNGLEIHKAGDGVEALELARTVRPDLIITDMMMPGMTGVELIRELSKDESLKSIPCIMVTSTKMTAKQIEILLKDHPALRYVLPKPCTLEGLRAAFKAALESGSAGPAKA